MLQNVMKTWKICENALLYKIFIVILLTFFFLSSGHKVDPEKVCTVKKFSIYFKNKIEKSFFNSKLLRYLKTFKAKNELKISLQCTVWVVL